MSSAYTPSDDRAGTGPRRPAKDAPPFREALPLPAAGAGRHAIAQKGKRDP